MFEKEAEEALQKRLGTYGYTSYQNCHKNYTDGFKDGAEYGYNKKSEEVEAVFDKVSELTDKLYLSGLSEKQIAVIEQIQDLIGR